MKQLVILFITILFVQNLKAQEVIYVDENGRIVEKEDIEREVIKRDMSFKEAVLMQRNANQIVVKPIDGKPIRSSSKLEIRKNYYLFEVIQAEDTSLIGKPVRCQIIERRKSNLSGLEGRLILRPLYIEKDSLQVPLIHA